MRQLPTIWSSLFVRVERPPRLEVLLWVLLASCIKSGLQAVFEPRTSFLAADAFKPQTVGVRGVGWAVLLLPSWITSHSFNRAVAVVLIVSAVCWLLKRGLVWSPIATALAYGLLDCLDKSRHFVFHHRLHAAAFMLLVFAGFYFFHRREIGAAVKDCQFWDKPIYPRWVLVLCLAYLGTFYGAAGLQKLIHGWLGSGTDSGVTLQLFCLLCPRRESLFARLLLDYRPLAAIAMATTLVLELGALFGLLWRPLRPWWAAGLIAMQLWIGLATGIWFSSLMRLLAITGFPLDRWLTLAQARLHESGQAGLQQFSQQG